jgi:hypothetical protein
VSIETLPAEIVAPEDEEDEVVEEDVWRPYRNRAARRRFVKQWGQQTRSRRTRGHSVGRKPKKRVLKVTAWLS